MAGVKRQIRGRIQGSKSGLSSDRTLGAVQQRAQNLATLANVPTEVPEPAERRRCDQFAVQTLEPLC